MMDAHDVNSGKLSDDIFGNGPVIHAEQITPERCCYITGLLDAAKYNSMPMEVMAEMMIKNGVKPSELTMPCVGKSRGLVQK